MRKEQLLAAISEEDIFGRLKIFSPYDLKNFYLCPFHNEKSPSFHFYKKGNRIAYKCFGCGQSGDIFTFIMKQNVMSFPQSIQFVSETLQVENPQETVIRKRTNIPYVQIGIRKIFQWQEKPFPEFGEQIDFWLKYGITRNILDEYKVKNIQWYSYISNKGKKIFKEAMVFKPVYLFLHGQEDALRFYMPHTKRKGEKWTGNTFSFDIFGLEQITTKQDIICLTAGQKDTLSLYANTGIRGTALQSESTMLTGDLYEKIRERCNKIIVLYDNDEAGYLGAKKISERYGISIADIAQVTKVKDISDYYEQLNLQPKNDDKIKQLINTAALQ